MKKIIKKLLENENIEYFGILPMSQARVINESLYARSFESFTPQSVIMLLVPYYSGEYEGRNISRYAVPRDYHLYFKGLYSRVEGCLKEKYPEYSFKGFSDHSPIGETYAASKCGLGCIGDLFQLINEKYGSYTFIGEIFTDAVFDEYDTREPAFCNHCGACRAACPMADGCLSELTQRKGELTEEEKALIADSGIVWGCDICRESCPMNLTPAVTPIEFFKTSLTPVISSEDISNMPKEEFLARAYSWRGRKTVLRNLAVFEAKRR